MKRTCDAMKHCFSRPSFRRLAPLKPTDDRARANLVLERGAEGIVVNPSLTAGDYGNGSACTIDVVRDRPAIAKTAGQRGRVTVGGDGQCRAVWGGEYDS